MLTCTAGVLFLADAQSTAVYRGLWPLQSIMYFINVGFEHLFCVSTVSALSLFLKVDVPVFDFTC